MLRGERNEKGQLKPLGDEALSKKVLGARVPNRILDYISHAARKKGVPVSELTREIFVSWVEDQEKGVGLVQEQQKRLTPQQMRETLFVSHTALKMAVGQGDVYFSDYCFERCGRRFKAVDVSRGD